MGATGRAGRRAGFTLLEAAVSLVIVGMVAIGALHASAAESRAAVRARAAAPAAALAAERLSRLQLAPPQALRALPDSLRRGALVAPAGRYDWLASASRVDGESDLYTLRVEVSWRGGSYALATRAYRPIRDARP